MTVNVYTATDVLHDGVVLHFFVDGAPLIFEKDLEKKMRDFAEELGVVLEGEKKHMYMKVTNIGKAKMLVECFFSRAEHLAKIYRECLDRFEALTRDLVRQKQVDIGEPKRIGK